MNPLVSANRFSREVDELIDRAPELGPIVERHGYPAYWLRPAGFRTLARIILEQQVSLASAATLFSRLDGRLGGVSPDSVLKVGEAGLKRLGMTRQKSRYWVELAQAVQDGKLPLEELATLSLDEAEACLTRVPGVGPWTAQCYLLLAVGHRNAWPPGDLALLRSLEEILPGADAMAISRTGQRWQPQRGVAARLLWHHYIESRGMRVDAAED